MTHADDEEWTEAEAAEYEEFAAVYHHVEAWRIAHSIHWGGPPYSHAELEYAHAEREKELGAV